MRRLGRIVLDRAGARRRFGHQSREGVGERTFRVRIHLLRSARCRWRGRARRGTCFGVRMKSERRFDRERRRRCDVRCAPVLASVAGAVAIAVPHRDRDGAIRAAVPHAGRRRCAIERRRVWHVHPRQRRRARGAFRRRDRERRRRRHRRLRLGRGSCRRGDGLRDVTTGGATTLAAGACACAARRDSSVLRAATTSG